MADIFLCQDARQLLTNKTVYFIGDSNMRAAYKDIIQLLVCDSLICNSALKSKMEESFNCDKLVFHGARTNGRNYREERSYDNGGFKARFYFITRCYDEYVETIFSKMLKLPPDIVIYNSCVWDVTRWGPKGVAKYKENLVTLMDRLKIVLPESCLFIWTTTLPVSSQKIKGGFLIRQVEFLRHTLRFDIMEANLFTSKLVSERGYDVLDLHYHIRWEIHRRTDDGVHWSPRVIRHITNMLLTHISTAWNKRLPKRLDSFLKESSNIPGRTDSLGQFYGAALNQDIGAPLLQCYFDFEENALTNPSLPLLDDCLSFAYPQCQMYSHENDYVMPWQEGPHIPQIDVEERPVFRFGQAHSYSPDNFVPQHQLFQANFPMQNCDTRQEYAGEKYGQTSASMFPNPFNVCPEPKANSKKRRSRPKKRNFQAKRPFRKTAQH